MDEQELVKKQTGQNALFLILSRYVIYSEDKTVMNEHLCIGWKYIKEMVLKILEMDKIAVMVGD